MSPDKRLGMKQYFTFYFRDKEQFLNFESFLD